MFEIVLIPAIMLLTPKVFRNNSVNFQNNWLDLLQPNLAISLNSETYTQYYIHSHVIFLIITTKILIF